MTDGDIPVLTVIMRRSFDKDSMEFLGEPSGPPGYDTGEFLRKYGTQNPHSTALKIIDAGKIIGAVILWITPEQNNHLGCLFVDSDLHDKGIGIRIWRMVEEMFPETKTWNTETPAFTRRNHHFYINKCGFHVIKVADPKSVEASYITKKVMA
jgi:N-acetylglutamate synthase-like GNAT family acetyltransferase